MQNYPLYTYEILLVVVTPLLVLYIKGNWSLRKVIPPLVIIPVLWYFTYAPLHELSHAAGTYLVGGKVIEYRLIPRFWLGEFERLQAGSLVLTQAVTTFGLLWAFLVIVIGTLAINNLSTVVKLYRENPAQAAMVWQTFDSVETGLGGGGGETMVNALWLLLLSWAALQARELPRLLNYLGLVIGVAGILSVVLAALGLMVVYGLGLILWLVWLGVVMLRGSTSLAAKEPPAFVAHPRPTTL